MGTNQPGIPEINIENEFKISFALCSHSKQAAQAITEKEEFSCALRHLHLVPMFS